MKRSDRGQKSVFDVDDIGRWTMAFSTAKKQQTQVVIVFRSFQK